LPLVFLRINYIVIYSQFRRVELCGRKNYSQIHFCVNSEYYRFLRVNPIIISEFQFIRCSIMA
jgi:hypothetical protein